jgi:ribonuclease Z
VDCKVTILGNTSATPTRDRDPSGQVLHMGNSLILIDCSEGSQSRILRYHINYQKIRYVFISHLHGDHFLGLPPLLNTMALHRRNKPITIVGPVGIQKVLSAIWDSTMMNFDFHIDIIELEDGKVHHRVFDAFEWKAFPLKHRVPCFGYRFSEKEMSRKLNIERCHHYGIHHSFFNSIKAGMDYTSPSGKVVLNSELTHDGPLPRSYSYITDTLPLLSVVPFIENSNLLYHESTFLDVLADRALETFHSTAKDAAEIADKASVNQLIIGHFSSRYHDLDPLIIEAKRFFPETRIAEQGKTFIIS